MVRDWNLYFAWAVPSLLFQREPIIVNRMCQSFPMMRCMANAAIHERLSHDIFSSLERFSITRLLRFFIWSRRTSFCIALIAFSWTNCTVRDVSCHLALTSTQFLPSLPSSKLLSSLGSLFFKRIAGGESGTTQPRLYMLVCRDPYWYRCVDCSSTAFQCSSSKIVMVHTSSACRRAHIFHLQPPNKSGSLE
jgi:hypothetical protein